MRLFALLLSLSACATHKAPADAPPLAILSTAPTPYTAEQIRDAIPAGTELRFRLSTPDGQTLISTTEFIATDATGTTFRNGMYTEAGDPVEPPSESTSTWVELRDHAAFPLESTKLEDVSIGTSLGTFDATLYTINADQAPFGPQVQRYWFAKDMPGPPVLFTVEVDGAEVQRFEMIARTGVGGD